MVANPGPSFKNRGDWLIHRSTGPLGDFQMQTCTRIIASEGLRDGWLYELTADDINRILARYKEHVKFWNASIDVIRAELQSFAKAVDSYHSFYEIANTFDSLRPARFPPDIVHNYAQIRKEQFYPNTPPNNPWNAPLPPQQGGQWRLTEFDFEELNQIKSSLYHLNPNTLVQAQSLGFCQVRGSFSTGEINQAVQELQASRQYVGNPVRYTITQLV